MPSSAAAPFPSRSESGRSGDSGIRRSRSSKRSAKVMSLLRGAAAVRCVVVSFFCCFCGLAVCGVLE